MFLRRYTRTVAGKKLPYYALVESVRTPDGPRQRVVAHLGELNHYQERRWQRTVVSGLSSIGGALPLTDFFRSLRTREQGSFQTLPLGTFGVRPAGSGGASYTPVYFGGRRGLRYVIPVLPFLMAGA